MTGQPSVDPWCMAIPYKYCDICSQVQKGRGEDTSLGKSWEKKGWKGNEKDRGTCPAYLWCFSLSLIVILFLFYGYSLCNGVKALSCYVFVLFSWNWDIVATSLLPPNELKTDIGWGWNSRKAKFKLALVEHVHWVNLIYKWLKFRPKPNIGHLQVS